MDLNARISIAGHRGLVGSAILRNLQARGYANFVLRTHAELNSSARPTSRRSSWLSAPSTEVCAPVLERVSGLRSGVDFTLGYSPERINDGMGAFIANRTIREMTRAGHPVSGMPTAAKIQPKVHSTGRMD